MNGKVYLVGAGPGDPGLITVRGLECLSKADVVIYDYLASPVLLGNVREDAEIIYVGKKGGDHTLSQEKINDLIVQKALKGVNIVRLKGGDPFIFGRGGEEAEKLSTQKIPFEIVPGVTSAIAGPAYAGIPLTHRKYTSTLAFVTGHENPDKAESSINWQSLAHGIGTIVFLMGVKNLSNIVRRLMDAGKSPDTPVALVRWGTTPKQEVVTGILSNIVEHAKAAKIKAPAIIVVGEVVNFRRTMSWFENRPLLGKTIIITRARAQASGLVAQLGALGAQCLEFPTIKIEPVADITPLNSAIDRLKTYNWLIFTSVNGVDSFFKQLYEKGLDARALFHLQIAVIGPATQKKLLDFGIQADLMPKNYQAESVVEAFAAFDIKGKQILLPRAKEARPILPVELIKLGAGVDEIAVYQTRQVKDDAAHLITRLQQGSVDLITFTSSSTVRNFKKLLPVDSFYELLEGVTIASIGPITTQTAIDLGFNVKITAKEFTISGLCRAIIDHCSANS